MESAATDESRFTYPVALNLRGRRCVVVGGGAVGVRKAAALVEAGAAVSIVAPTLGAEGGEGTVDHIAEPFRPEHLDGAFLVVAATDSGAVNAAVEQAARERHVLVNLAAPGDGGEAGDFATMATVRRGDMLLSVTCGGAGPALSARLRRELAERYGPEWEPLVRLFGEVRAAARQLLPEAPRRTEALRRLAEQADDLATLLAGGNADQARKEALACLQS